MAISTFDTHKFVRRMEAAGMTLEQAEAHADALTEAFTVNLEHLVTKDYFDSRLEARFAEQDARIDTRFAEQKAYMDTRLAEQDAKFDKRFNKLESQVASNQRVFVWTQAIVVSAVILPYLERLMAL